MYICYQHSMSISHMAILWLWYSNMERSNVLLKLHKHFGHVSQEKLLNLLKTAGMVNQEIKYLLKNIYVLFVTNIYALK